MLVWRSPQNTIIDHNDVRKNFLRDLRDVSYLSKFTPTKTFKLGAFSQIQRLSLNDPRIYGLMSPQIN